MLSRFPCEIHVHFERLQQLWHGLLTLFAHSERILIQASYNLVLLLPSVLERSALSVYTFPPILLLTLVQVPFCHSWTMGTALGCAVVVLMVALQWLSWVDGLIVPLPLRPTTPLVPSSVPALSANLPEQIHLSWSGKFTAHAVLFYPIK